MKTRINVSFAKDQVFYDEWARKEAEAQYRGRCPLCRCTLFQINGADPDPRGQLTEKHACNSFEAQEYSMKGADFVSCFGCANTKESYEKLLAMAKATWQELEPAKV